MKNEYDDNPSNQDEVELDVLKYLSKLRSISCLLNSVIMFFLILLILAIFFSNYLVMTYFYKTINSVYLNQYIVYPLSDSNQNFTQTLNMRINSLQEILFESKLVNLKIATDLVFTSDIKFFTGVIRNNDNKYIQNINNPEKDLFDYMINFEGGSDKQTENQINSLNSKFNSLAYFLFFFRGNSVRPFGIKEFIIKDANINNYLIYSENLQNSKNVMIDSFANSKRWDMIAQDLKKNEFVDYIIKDPYTEKVNLYNYLKINAMSTKLNDKNYALYLTLRMDCDQMSDYFNPIRDNVTIIFKHTDILSTGESSLNFLPMSSYMKSFFYYGITNNLKNWSPSMSSMIFVNSNILKNIQDDNYYLTNMINFFRLLNYQNPEGIFNSTSNLYFNNNLFEEFFVYGSMFKNISQYYFNVNIFNQTGIGNPTYKECLRNLNISYSQIICEIINFQTIQLQTLNFNYLTNSVSSYLDDELNKNFFKAIYFSNDHIFVSYSESNYEKKFLIYLNKLNNLDLVFIDMITVQEYSEIERNFIDNTQFSSLIISTVLIASSVIIFLFSFLITINSVKSLIDRISQISQIKKLIIVKDEDVTAKVIDITSKDFNFDEEKISKLFELTTKALNGSINDREKLEFIEIDCFDKQLITIICESKTKLRNVLKSIDNGNFLFKKN
jgi:hypothetical protein